MKPGHQAWKEKMVDPPPVLVNRFHELWLGRMREALAMAAQAERDRKAKLARLHGDRAAICLQQALEEVYEWQQLK